MQTKKEARAWSSGEKHNAVTDTHVQSLKKRHRNATELSVYFVTAVDDHDVVPYAERYRYAPRSFVDDLDF